MVCRTEDKSIRAEQIRCQQCDINVIWSGYCRKRMIDFSRLTDNVSNPTSNKQGSYASMFHCSKKGNIRRVSSLKQIKKIMFSSYYLQSV